MQFPSVLKQWLNLRRIIPLLTILGAGAAIILAMLGIVNLSIAEGIIVTLLALLASDALTERIGILERIERSLNTRVRCLKLEDRKGFPVSLEERLANAKQVYLLGVNLHGIVSQYQGLFSMRAQDGCQFKFITTAPEFYGLGVPTSWYGSQKEKNPALNLTKDTIKKLIRKVGQDEVELRYTPCPPPYTLLIIDPDKSGGEVQVEFYTYEGNPHKRPHFILKRDIDPRWYDFFREEFDLVWKQSQE